jgi:hypothetical protein
MLSSLKLTGLLLFLAVGTLLAKPQVAYTVTMDQAPTHYFEVQLTVTDHKADYVDFKMPVWAPGSYLVREFARHVEGFTATDGKGAPWPAKKSARTPGGCTAAMPPR